MSDDNEPDLWPAWNEPATKGDIVTALIATRATVVDIYVTLSALLRGDVDKARKTLMDLNASDDALGKVIDEIGGGRDGS